MIDIAPIWKENIQGYNPWLNTEDFYFDVECAERICNFFPQNFKHCAGAFGNKPFELLNWQKKATGHLFAWKRKKDNTRRYREIFFYVPKKSGKTQLAAAYALILLMCDSEPGAEIYSASGDITQAGIIFNAAKYMVETNVKLSKYIDIYNGYKTMKVPKTNSYWKVLSSEAKTKHGPNIHGLILDELHVFPDNELIDTLTHGTISRRQPLIIYLTTADYAGESACNNLLTYSKKVRDNPDINKFFLPIIYEADVEDDWTSEEVWKKVNPSYGVTVHRDYFVSEVSKCKENPSLENPFKRLHLNMQTRTQHAWLNLKDWDNSGQNIDKEVLLGKKCYIGIDLSSTRDISAVVLYFPEYKALLPFFWVPEYTSDKKIEYSMWSKQGYCYLTNGKTIDIEEIEAKILELRDKYQITSIAYDPAHATVFSTKLADIHGFEMIMFRQGWISMNEPSKNFEKMVINKEITHFNNPILRWMVSNVEIKEGPAADIKPIKKSKDSPLKIDGVIASIMAIAIADKDIEQSSVFDLPKDEFEKLKKELYG